MCLMLFGLFVLRSVLNCFCWFVSYCCVCVCSFVVCYCYCVVCLLFVCVLQRVYRCCVFSSLSGRAPFLVCVIARLLPVFVTMFSCDLMFDYNMFTCVVNYIPFRVAPPLFILFCCVCMSLLALFLSCIVARVFVVCVLLLVVWLLVFCF